MEDIESNNGLLNEMCHYLTQVVLPDVEFLVNLGDWPLEFRSNNQNPMPIFSWCGSDETYDIVMPTYDITESTLETMGRYVISWRLSVITFP